MWNVAVPTIPGCFTWGATLDEAFQRVKEAIDGNVEAREARGEPVPEPHPVIMGTVRR